MKRQTRLFVIGAAGILVVGLGTGLVASYMGLQNFAIIGSSGPEELHYVSNDAEWVAFANVREIMDSQLRQKIREFHPGGDTGSEKFKAETGIDIETDIDRVVASAFGSSAQAEHDRPLLIARGRFDQVRIEGLVREHGGTADTYKGKRVFTVAEPGGQNIGLAFLETDLTAVGTPASVRAAIDTKAASSNITDNADIMKLVHEVEDGNAWAVSRFDALANNPHIPSEVAARLPAITWFAASGHINGGVSGSIHAVARDEMSAQDLREVIRGFMALARLQIGQKSEFADLLDSIQLSGQGTSVALNFSIPSQLIDSLGALTAQRRQGPAPSPDGIAPSAPQKPAAPRAPSI